jgi:hypothetical protein
MLERVSAAIALIMPRHISWGQLVRPLASRAGQIARIVPRGRAKGALATGICESLATIQAINVFVVEIIVFIVVIVSRHLSLLSDEPPWLRRITD